MSNVMIDEKYMTWIDKYVKKRGNRIIGDCQDAASAMVRAFPELKKDRGHVTTRDMSNLAHHWCVDALGNVVDPTAKQFEMLGHGPIFQYHPLKVGDEVKVGKCMNCGGNIYVKHSPDAESQPKPMFCRERCSVKFMADFNGEEPPPDPDADAENSPYAVYCPIHRQVKISKAEYTNQKFRPNMGWTCPICRNPAGFDDEYYESKIDEYERRR